MVGGLPRQPSIAGLKDALAGVTQTCELKRGRKSVDKLHATDCQLQRKLYTHGMKRAPMLISTLGVGPIYESARSPPLGPPCS